MRTGDCKCRDSIMDFSTVGGAEADNAMNGASVKALRPPILLKAVLKSDPLQKAFFEYLKVKLLLAQTILEYSAPHPQLPWPNTS